MNTLWGHRDQTKRRRRRTRAVGWTLERSLSSPKIQTSLTSGSRPSTQRMNLDLSASQQPDSEGRRMAPTGAGLGMISRKLQQKEWAKQKGTATIFKKMGLKLRQFLSGKISHWHDQQKIFNWHDQQKIFNWHNQRNYQKMKKGTYQMTRTQIHHRQARHQRKINAIKKEKCCKHRKDDTSDLASSDNSDSSDDRLVC